MALACEEYFIGKIKSTLAHSPSPLTEREETILRTKLSELIADAAELRALNDRCVAALRQRFNEDVEVSRNFGKRLPETGLSAVDAALEWRRQSVKVYESSECAITGVVQNWYRDFGRKQELSVSPLGRIGCGSTLLLLALSFGVLGAIVTGC